MGRTKSYHKGVKTITSLTILGKEQSLQKSLHLSLTDKIELKKYYPSEKNKTIQSRKGNSIISVVWISIKKEGLMLIELMSLPIFSKRMRFSYDL